MMTFIIDSARAPSVAGRTFRCLSAILAKGWGLGSTTISFAPLSLASSTSLTKRPTPECAILLAQMTMHSVFA